ncbi:hypothetical protein CFP56_008032 [Quercus suber]|uniref:Uncharacterized protein n=1 Tax=Quercus suber TaxID=58331 RepID=A0AAW0L702_QUESU
MFQNNIKSCYQAKELSAKSSSAVSDKKKRLMEESKRKIMDLNCWGTQAAAQRATDRGGADPLPISMAKASLEPWPSLLSLISMA